MLIQLGIPWAGGGAEQCCKASSLLLRGSGCVRAWMLGCELRNAKCKVQNAKLPIQAANIRFMTGSFCGCCTRGSRGRGVRESLLCTTIYRAFGATLMVGLEVAFGGSGW